MAATSRQAAARYPLFASAALALAKLVASLLTGSLALLADALRALIDLCAHLTGWLAARISGKAPDETAPGRNRSEAIVALIETGLLLALAVIIAIVAISHLSHGSRPPKQTAIAFIVLGISIAVDLVRWRGPARGAGDLASLAPAADGLHLPSGLIYSALVALGLAGTVFGFRQGDGLAAVCVAAVIAVAGYRLGARTIEILTDVTPRGIGDGIQALAAAQRGVADVERVRVRRVGTTLVADLAVGVPSGLSDRRIRLLKQELTASILARHPGAQVSIVANERTMEQRRSQRLRRNDAEVSPPPDPQS